MEKTAQKMSPRVTDACGDLEDPGLVGHDRDVDLARLQRAACVLGESFDGACRLVAHSSSWFSCRVSVPSPAPAPAPDPDPVPFPFPIPFPSRRPGAPAF